MQLPTFGQAGHTLTIIAAQNPNRGHLKALHDGPLTDLVQSIMQGTLPDREALRKFLGLGPLKKVLLIDYDMSLEEMIAAGRYDSKNDNLNSKNYPVIGEGKVEFEWDLVHPNRDISTADAHKETAKDSDPANPWMDAKTEHLLAFGAAYPEEQQKFPIVALGSVAGVDGVRRVPGLDKDGSERGLGLGWYENVWNAGCRFLRVRKASPPAAA